MKKLLTLITLLAATASTLPAQESKPQVRFGGTFYLSAYYDTYKSVDNREGVFYSYPLPPSLDERGHDINEVGQFGMSVYATRLHGRLNGLTLMGAQSDFYIETDFLGATTAGLQMIRLRHAYLDLRWNKNELLFGQTNDLLMPAELIAGVLTPGAGSPITPLSRPAMVRYGLSLGQRWKLYAAAAYHRPATGEPDAARNNGFPSGELRVQYSGPRWFFGVAGSYQSLMPRLLTESGLKANERIGSPQATLFLRYTSAQGATLKLQSVYGYNLTRLGMPGGYAKVFHDPEKEHYDYTNFKGMSTWLDLESRSYNGYRFGLFAGYFENLGTDRSVDPELLFTRDADLHLTGRLGPRMTWSQGNLMLGVEYSLFFSRWGMQFNSKYRPVQSHDLTYNHRGSLLVRYAF